MSIVIASVWQLVLVLLALHRDGCTRIKVQLGNYSIAGTLLDPSPAVLLDKASITQTYTKLGIDRSLLSQNRLVFDKIGFSICLWN